MTGKLIVEAVSVGIITVLIGLAIVYIIMKDDIKDEMWGKLAGSLFILGALIHLLCEVTGINKWYCTNGNACLVV